MKNYTIYIKSNEHPRTINTPIMARTYYTAIRVQGCEALTQMVDELRAMGKVITDIRTELGTRVWM